MPHLIPIRSIRSFCIAAKCLSLKNAAETLYLSPSAVSHQIKQLEEFLGTTLFDRQSRTINLTPSGKQFYDSINPLLDELEATINDFRKEKEKVTLSISMPEFFSSELFIPSINEWTDLNNDINLELVTIKPHQSNSKSSHLSIILSSGKPVAKSVHPLFALRYVPSCNETLFNHCQKNKFETLNNVPLILHSSRPWAWHQWAEISGVTNFKPAQTIKLDSMFSIARAAQKGMGIALIPMPICKSWFKENFLYKIFETELITSDRYYLIENEVSHKQAINKTVNWIIKRFQNYT